MTTRTRVGLTLLAWLAMVGFDFFLHAGLLSCIYNQASPFLLPAEQAFILIPLGYLSFLLLAILLVWLMPRLDIQGGQRGAVFGLKIGAIIWGSFMLGLASIATAPLSILAAWFIGQTVELGLAGAVIGSALADGNYRRLTALVAGLIIASLVVSIILQNTLFAGCV
jgi:FtsH-binding integral membrane protein